jgi:hypothetical protein
MEAPMPDTSPWEQKDRKFEVQQFLNNLTSLKDSIDQLALNFVNFDVVLPQLDFRAVVVELRSWMDLGRAHDMCLHLAWERGHFMIYGITIKERRANESPWNGKSGGAPGSIDDESGYYR